MRSLLACSALLLLPLSALAADAPNCKFTAARALKLDVAGAKAVVFEVNQHDLKVVARAGGGQLDGRACKNKPRHPASGKPNKNPIQRER